MSKVLLGGWNKKELSILNDFICKMNIKTSIILTDNHLDLILKDILTESSENNKGNLLPERIIIFDEMDKKGISDFLDGFKKLGLNTPIFAMITEHSVNWKLNDLISHLIEEREEFKRMKHSK